ncbi:MAG: PD-(D/E)XK nuclease family protein [Dysgonamonadaceae bacterium]|jgi:hypothetical protein|nr:PD-(D/E)XK nuclease family protein [Dysgonamonadaceae bacterium]
MNNSTFLAIVARDLVNRLGGKMSDVTIVFPGRRAHLFFNRLLYSEFKSPLWSPQYLSIEDLFDRLSTFRRADTIRLTADLYLAYKDSYLSKYGKNIHDTLDEFFFFGEILLRDFDDIDRNLINAGFLYGNLADLDKIGNDLSFLSDGQREELSRRFGRSFLGESRLQEEFRMVWNILGDVYLRFRDRLRKRNEAYCGMQMRDVVESNLPDADNHQYVFIGFNALSKSEKVLFNHLKPSALFYWDADEYYLNHEAGRHIRENILKFGSAIDIISENKSASKVIIPKSKYESEIFLAGNPDTPFSKLLKPCESDSSPDNNFKQSSESGLSPESESLSLENNSLLSGNNSLFSESESESLFLNPSKEITFISASSENEQTGVISEWIDSLKMQFHETSPDSAIILCNESLLPVVTHAIPYEKTRNINVTMGFPEGQTPIAGFLYMLSEMQMKSGREGGMLSRKYILPVLRHPYAKMLFPKASQIEHRLMEENLQYADINVLENRLLFTYTHDLHSFCKYLIEVTEAIGRAISKNVKNDSSDDLYIDLYRESVFRAWQILNRLYGLIKSDGWRMEKSMFVRLMRKLFSVTQVPFHGEPLKGLQIMGMLETRTLDFKNILLLSVNEGFMPAGSVGDNSFIPRFIRHELGLSTVQSEDSIYAYYFYRLLQRAEKITLVYNTGKTSKGKAEMSRFMLQLLVDGRMKIKRFQLLSPVRPVERKEISFPKTAELLNLLKSLYDFNINPDAKAIYPSILNTFIDCSLRFYYLKVKCYKVEKELTDEMDASIFGTIFHHSAERLYKMISDRYGRNPDGSFFMRKEHIENFLENSADINIERLVSLSFTKHFFNNRNVDRSQYNGEQLINFRVICKMIRRLLEFDRNRAPFTILGLEYRNYSEYALRNSNTKIRIGGVIDRLEEKDGRIVVIDYKTGSSGKTFKTLPELAEEKERRASHIFQTFVYSSIIAKHDTSGRPIIPALLYLQEAGKKDYSPVIQYNNKPIEDFRTIHPEFEPIFLQKIEELFDPNVPFKETSVKENCKYCEFQELCGKFSIT